MVSDNMLSQDEIDALLKQGDDEGGEGDSDSKATNTLDDLLTAEEQDALGEIGNISFGSSSTALSSLLNQKVDITTPTLGLVYTDKLEDEFPKPHVSVYVDYTIGFEGVNMYVIQMEDAKVIADLMLGGDGKAPDQEINDMHLSAVQEAMNQMMGSAATSMSTIFNTKIDISPPKIDIFDASEDNIIDNLQNEKMLLKISFRMRVGDLIDSNIMQLIPIPFAKKMGQMLLNPAAATLDTTEIPTIEEPVQQPAAQQTETVQQSRSVQQRSESISAQPVNQNQRNQPIDNRSVQPVQFANFDQPENEQYNVQNLDLLLDIPLSVTVELGRTNKMIKDILDLSQGSIIELDKLAGEPVDILVNNKLIAKGEVVVIEENFGVRVTDILSQIDRLQKLQ